MSADIGPGDIVEHYRGSDAPPVVKGGKYRVTRVWEDPEYGPCMECLPGENAPCIELADVRFPPEWGPICACTFRPIYRRGEGVSLSEILKVSNKQSEHA